MKKVRKGCEEEQERRGKGNKRDGVKIFEGRKEEIGERKGRMRNGMDKSK